MPIYEYRCASCGFQKEYLRKASDPLLSTCPDCGKETFKKMLTAAGFQLKGSGWYVSDFKNNGTAPKKDKAEGGKAEGGKAEGSKTEAPKSDGGDSGAKSSAPAGESGH